MVVVPAAIIWYNQPNLGHMEGGIDQDAFYASCPVVGGEKWTVTDFFVNSHPYY